MARWQYGNIRSCIYFEIHLIIRIDLELNGISYISGLPSLHNTVAVTEADGATNVAAIAMTIVTLAAVVLVVVDALTWPREFARLCENLGCKSKVESSQ